MIEGNVLKFGYGDIAVNSDDLTQSMTFRQFNSTAQCGEHVYDNFDNIEYVSDKIVLKFSCKEYCEFYNNLQHILSKEISTFNFKGYVFDFTNLHEQSVNACKMHLKNAMRNYILCTAA